ncbi:MAG: class I SAM-dependent methyltransferase [Gemmatimonadaceae bacterium]
MTPASATAPATKGLVVHWAARYDWFVWLMTLGRERRFRERLLEPVRLKAGESVLDVGSGTGTLAIVAKRQVGPTGVVHGVEPSPAMLARARHKAGKAGLDVRFVEGVAESLPFADARFDAVLSTVMLHHLGSAARPVAVAEMRRVLKPGGRLLVVDFAGAHGGKGPLLHFHRHGHVDPHVLTDLVTGSGLKVVDAGPVGAWRLNYVLATA